MKVKLVRRIIKESFPYYEVYDIYVGIPRLLLPFMVKWYVDETGLSEHQAKERIWNSFLSVKGTKLVTTVE